MALKYGLNVAKSWVVKRGEIPNDMVYPIITKPLTSYSNWKADYHICNNEQELVKAYSLIKVGENILLQQYIFKKNKLCIDGVCVNQGMQMFATIASTYTYIWLDYFSVEMIVRNFDNCFLEEKLYSMFKEIGYEGIFSVEFMIDGSGDLWFLEINFRNSTWNYTSTKLGMNLPLLWAEGMILNYIPAGEREAIPEGYIALAEYDDYIHRVVHSKNDYKKTMARRYKKR